MALTQQDLEQAFAYVMGKGLSIQGLTDGGTDLSRMYLAPVLKYNTGGTAATLVRLAVSLLKGDTGKSAFEQWKEEPGNSNKTITDFFASMKGEKGDRFLFSDFTDEHLADLALTYEKLTPDQKEEMKLHFSDLSAADIAVLEKPATDAAAEVRKEMVQISEDVNQLIADTEEVKDRADKSASDADAARISLSGSVQQKLAEVDNKMLTVQDGEDGKTTQLEIGTVKSGSQPEVYFADKGTDAQGNPIKALNFTLEKGNTGAVPILETGETTTGIPGTKAFLSLVPNGTTPDGVQKYKTNAVIPAGATGSVEGVYKIQDIDHVPGESDLTYEEAGKTLPYPIGAELRYYDPDKVEHVFYKLFDLAAGKAVWKLAGSGDGSDDGLVFLSVPENFDTSYIEIKDGGLGGL